MRNAKNVSKTLNRSGLNHRALPLVSKRMTYKALKCLASFDEPITLKTWGRRAAELRIYRPRGAGTDKDCARWASRVGKYLAHFELVQRQLLRIKYRVILKYKVTEQGHLWLRAYERDILKGKI